MRKAMGSIQFFAVLAIAATAGRLEANPSASLAKGAAVMIGALALFAAANIIEREAEA